MRKTLVTEDTTILGLEQFIAEARGNGARDEDGVEVIGAVSGSDHYRMRARPARLSVELPTSLVRRLVRR
jgi:hypothetical protein